MPSIIFVHNGQSGIGSAHIKIMYVMYGSDKCVFSQIEYGGDSSINRAEEIVAAIEKLEGLKQDTCRFFDLQTRKAYRGNRHSPGMYEFEELEHIHSSDHPTEWALVECPAQVVEDFDDAFDAQPTQQVIMRPFESTF